MTKKFDSGDERSRLYHEFARAAAACGGTLTVRPIVTGDDWTEPADIVGRASSYDEALQLITDAGYEIIPADDGGCHEPDPQDESDEFFVTVKPAGAEDDEQPVWTLVEDGVEIERIVGGTAEEALQIAIDGVDRANCPDARGTIWVDLKVRDEDGDTVAEETIQLDPEEPECSDDDGHEWADEVVRGSGGGVKITNTCAHCGLRRVIDTWATRPDTGEQGLQTVEYLDADED